MRKFSAILALLFITGFAFPTQSAFGQSSGWVETLGAKMRIQLEKAGEQGPWRAVLNVELEEGWNSYWLDPGYNGIPPQISVTNKMGETIETTLVFPAPEQLGYGKNTYAGYLNRFSLGIVPQNTQELPAQIDAFLGICSDICVPFQASFNLSEPKSESLQKLSNFRVNKIFENMPEALGVIDAALEGDNLSITLPVTPNEDYRLIVSGLEDWQLSDLTQTATEDDSVRFSGKVITHGRTQFSTAFSLASKDGKHAYSGSISFDTK